MGGLLGRHKKESGKKICSYQICPSNQQKPDDDKNIVVKQVLGKQDVTDNATKPTSLEWTDVALHVPDQSPGKIVSKNDNTAPIPPPRKHRVKMDNIQVEKIIPIMIKPAEKTTEKLITKQISVEEEIIIPKKEPIHICDGTHSHVTNIVNGKVIHSEIIKPRPSHDHAKNNPLLLSKNNALVHAKNNHNAMKQVTPARPKNLSTVSLPNYEELTIKSKHAKTPIQNPSHSKKKPKRHISVISLPTESKISLSAATAARLENYVMRCKSFGQLPPRQLLEKLQNQEDFTSESDDSWEGLDEWNMEILEHDGATPSPHVPRSRLEAPTSNLSSGLVNEKLFPDTIEEVDEITKRNTSPIPHNKPLLDMKRSEGRRESIDDFFEAKAENPFTPPNIQELKDTAPLGRRGSDGFFGYDKKCYPFKSPESNPNFKSDTFFSNSFLEHESQRSPNDLKMRRKSAGGVLHRIDSVNSDVDTSNKGPIKVLDNDDDLLDTFQNFYHRNEDADNNKSEKKIESLEKNIKPAIDVKHPTLMSHPTVVKPAEKVEHSGLLKFIQNNSADNKLKSPTNDKITLDRILHDELTTAHH